MICLADASVDGQAAILIEFDLQCGWQATNGSRLLATFRAQVLEGMRLPLKLATLSGEMRYFFE